MVRDVAPVPVTLFLSVSAVSLKCHHAVQLTDTTLLPTALPETPQRKNGKKKNHCRHFNMSRVEYQPPLAQSSSVYRGPLAAGVSALP